MLTEKQYNKLKSKLESFNSLPENWDSYGASPIHFSTIHKAIKVLDLIRDSVQDDDIFIGPSPNNSIEFSFDLRGEQQ